MTTLVPGSMINQTTLFTASSLYSGNINTGNIAAGNVSVTGTLPPPVGIYANAANSLALATNSAARLIVDANGNVGVGTAAPVQVLHVQGNAYLTGTVGIGTAAGTTLDVYGTTMRLSGSGGVSSYIATTYSTGQSYRWIVPDNTFGIPFGSIGLWSDTQSAYRMVVNSGGNVGITATNPVDLLDFGSGTNGTGITWGGTNSRYQSIWASYSSADLVAGVGVYGSRSADQYLASYTGSIGRSIVRLGYTGSISFLVDPASAQTAGTVVSPTERMRISNAGYVTKPYQPAWYAAFPGFTCSSASVQYTSTSYNAPAINVSNSFITSTGVFTCPVAGTYLLFGSFLRNAGAFVFRGHFQKNGANCDLGEWRTTEGFTGYNESTSHVALVSAAVGDQLRWTISCDTAGGQIYTSGYNYFGGYLLG